MPIQLILAAIVAAACFGAGWQTHSWKTDAEVLRGQQQATQDARREAMRVDRVAEAHVAEKAAADLRIADLRRRLYAEAQKPDNRAACLSDDGLRILSDAAVGSNAARGLAPAVSSASGAH